MREAVIVSTARTPIGRAYRGAFNDTEAPAMGGHVVREAVKRAGLAPEEIEDVMDVRRRYALCSSMRWRMDNPYSIRGRRHGDSFSGQADG